MYVFTDYILYKYAGMVVIAGHFLKLICTILSLVEAQEV